MTTPEIREQIQQYVDQLSPRRLRVAADFLAYLAERESQEATEELIKIPGFVEAFEKPSKASPQASSLTGEKSARMYNVCLISDTEEF